MNELWYQPMAIKANICNVEGGTGCDDVRGCGTAGSRAIVCGAVAMVHTRGFPFAIVAAVAGVIRQKLGRSGKTAGVTSTLRVVEVVVFIYQEFTWGPPALAV